MFFIGADSSYSKVVVFTTPAWRAGRHNVKLSICLYVLLVTFSRPLIGHKRECYIVEEVIEVDELDKGNISAALGKQDK